ncbi:ABC transporter ATP-binding protein [Okibacterium endophyticum]
MIVFDQIDVRNEAGLPVLDRLGTHVGTGEVRAFVGESGSGKTTLALTILGQIRPGLHHHSGSVAVAGFDPLRAHTMALRAYRRKTVAWLGQDPGLSLTPWLTVRQLLSEAGDARRMPDERLADLLAPLRLEKPHTLLDRRPADLSGGQRRRIAFARAIARQPEVLILDEPTAGLDQQAINDVLDAFSMLRTHSNVTTLFITHDLAIAERVADTISVLHQGRLVETKAAADLRTAPRSGVTRTLLAAELRTNAHGPAPTRQADAPILELRDLEIVTPAGAPLTEPLNVTIGPGEGVAILGPSGIGKSTLAGTIIGSHSQAAGNVLFCEEPLASRFELRPRGLRRAIQLIPQDPAASLNPALTVRTQLQRAVRRAEPTLTRHAVDRRIESILQQVHLPSDLLQRRSPSLSGGQAQRVAIARALAHRPRLLICDESTAALDPTAQRGILDTLNELRARTGLALIVITHSPNVAAYTCDRVLELSPAGHYTIRPATTAHNRGTPHETEHARA